jgi:hypothetical protein
MAISLALLAVLGGTLGCLYLYGIRTFAESANYMDFETQNRAALNRISQTLRQATKLTYFDSQTLTFLVGSNSVSFTYSPGQRALLRQSGGMSYVLVGDCDSVNFGIFQRNPIQGGYDCYPAATPADCKVVQLDWRCSRPVLGSSNTASAVSARVVIRKQ